ncbi:hypothetical protein ISN44_As06g032420 [Arabidopsis suecica]|uniref:Uncharacterized protein n=1 Tax=Arabidopsis suecica TaxID=45249 RepID=A0A8T2CFB5_ARASU|nr:hypothetical protein ISN44_As06g032420 [Arabidopsis suecica]
MQRSNLQGEFMINASGCVQQRMGMVSVPRTVGRLGSHQDNVLPLLLSEINVVAPSD